MCLFVFNQKLEREELPLLTGPKSETPKISLVRGGHQQ